MHPRLYIIILWHQCVLTLFIYLASHTWGQETISSVSIHDNNIDSHYTSMYFYNWQNKVNWKSSCRITFYDQCQTEVEVKVWSATEQVVSEQVCLLSRSNFSNLKNKVVYINSYDQCYTETKVKVSHVIKHVVSDYFLGSM